VEDEVIAEMERLKVYLQSGSKIKFQIEMKMIMNVNYVQVRFLFESSASVSSMAPRLLKRAFVTRCGITIGTSTG